MFHTAKPEDVKAGKITDVYFDRTMRILKARGMDARVRMEIIAKTLPEGWDWAVLAGVEEVSELLSGLPVNVRSMPEGTVFFPYQPVMEVEGNYGDFGHYETAILGLICQASGIATKAARVKKLAGDRPVISFGARRMHPVLAPMIERNAYIGGCDGVSVMRSAELIGHDPMGTMPHALILIFGDTVKAVKAFDEVIEPGASRTALIDTFNDEKFEAIRVAEAMGSKIYAMRLDTPGSRRGNFYRILEEVRWELDLRGHRGIKLFVSGGITENDIPVLNPVVDGYGIGTSIANAPVVDFAMDIVEMDGRPVSKRGKASGAKSVIRCLSCLGYMVVPCTGMHRHCECGGEMTEILLPLMRDGKLISELPGPDVIREKVLQAVGRLPGIGKAFSEKNYR
ncbi:MAG: nicotinate phosphoribosyltransferase [Nitrospirota bacterium]